MKVDSRADFLSMWFLQSHRTQLLEETSACFNAMLLPSCNLSVWVDSFFLFFSFFSLFFYWRIIALQNFVVFCQTSTWIRHKYTYIPSPLNLPPISRPEAIYFLCQTGPHESYNQSWLLLVLLQTCHLHSGQQKQLRNFVWLDSGEEINIYF